MRTGPDISPEGDDLDPTLLERHWLGETSPAETAQVDAWLRARPGRSDRYDQLVAGLRVGSFPGLSVDERTQRTAAILQAAKVPTELDTDEMPLRRDTTGPHASRIPLQHQPRTWSRSKASGWMAIAGMAAAASVLVTIGLTRLAPRAPAVATSVRTIVTPRGQRAEMRLADGSRVILGAGSTLRITEPFGQGQRDVYLDGEAYFDVTHDAAHPLRVRTAHAVTEDIGTQFVITAMPGDTADRVVVSEGAVAIRSAMRDTATVLLRANDMGTVSAAGAIHAQRGVAVEQYFTWTHGVIRFDAMVFADAIPVIERQYDVRIHLTDSSLARQRVSGSFAAGQMEAMLKGLAFVLDAHYANHGKDVTLSPIRP